MTGIEQGVSLTVALVCLTAACLMWTVGKGHFPRLTAVLVLTGAAGLLNTQVGTWARQALNWFIGFTGDLLAQLLGTRQVNGVVIGALIAAGTLYVFLVHMIKDKNVDKGTLSAAATVPLTVTAIPGPLGAAAVTVIAAIIGAMAHVVGAVFGLG